MSKRDFTLKIYKALLIAFKQAGYTILTFEQFLTSKQLPEKILILRHDSDIWPKHDLNMAKIENEYGVKSSYYFRITKRDYNEKIIKQIADFGHEIGYHYEDLSLVKGDFESAIKSFEKHLKMFRQFYPVKTLTMHGSPLSNYDNRTLWGKYDYRDYGIIGEPYLDLDFNEIFYLTDTGSMWNNTKIIVRDKVKTKFDYSFRTTQEMIVLLKADKLPPIIMVNTHPARWNDNIILWSYRFILQAMKNVAKPILNKLRS